MVENSSVFDGFETPSGLDGLRSYIMRQAIKSLPADEEHEIEPYKIVPKEGFRYIQFLATQNQPSGEGHIAASHLRGFVGKERKIISVYNNGQLDLHEISYLGRTMFEGPIEDDSEADYWLKRIQSLAHTAMPDEVITTDK